MRNSVVLCLIKCTVLITAYYYEEEQQPILLTAAVGDYMVFNCHVDYPQPDIAIPHMIEWLKDNKTFFTWFDGLMTSMEPYIGRVSLIHDNNNNNNNNNNNYENYAFKYGKASINLTSIRDTDNGWYQCVISFPNRTPSRLYNNNGTWYYLTVNGGNLLAVPPINQTVNESEEVSFVCLPKDPELKVIWRKDGIELNDYKDLSHRSWITPEHTLVINPTDMSDTGSYECEVRNYRGENQSARAFLNVQYKAKVIFAPPEIYLPYGKAAMIDCHFRANPPLTNLRWEKDGFLFDPYNIQGVFYRRNGSLYFTRVDETHNGYYTCTPYNDLGTQGPSTPIRVIVQRPPVFVQTPHNLYLRKLGETVEMPCDARDATTNTNSNTDDNHEHKPIIVWYRKDGTNLPDGRYTINDGNLTIINLQENDRGLYQCSATNKAATITVETELLVENIPSSVPHNLTALITTDSIHLKWLINRQRTNNNYSIWYRPIEATEWKIYPTNIRNQEATITGLDPGREYEFMVLSRDDSGDGLFSKSIRVKTKSLNDNQIDNNSNNNNIINIDKYRTNFLPPIGFPRNVTVLPTDMGYLITWLPPEYGIENLKIYIVRWFQDDYLVGSYETEDTSFLLSSLTESAEYRIQVIALTIDNQQAISEKIKLIIPEYKRIRAISTGIITGLAFLIAAFLTIYYVRKRWFQSYGQRLKNGNE